MKLNPELVRYRRRLHIGEIHLPVHRHESDGELLVLGDWIERRTYARLEGGIFRLEDFRDGSGPVSRGGR